MSGTLLKTKSVIGKLLGMGAKPIRILTVERDDDGMVVTFSDGTTAGYLVQELLDLRPQRLHTAEFKELPPDSD